MCCCMLEGGGGDPGGVFQAGGEHCCCGRKRRHSGTLMKNCHCRSVPFVARALEQCHDVESNPGPRTPNSTTNSNNSRTGTGSSSNSNESNALTTGRSHRPSRLRGAGGKGSPKKSLPQTGINNSNGPKTPQQETMTAEVGNGSATANGGGGGGGSRIDRLERELQSLQSMLGSLNSSVLSLQESIESMKPAYNTALQVLATTASAAAGEAAHKGNLVFHGIAPDPLELQMEGEPEFCRDVLETRVKQVFREHLRISRDMPFTQVYRIDMPNAAEGEVRPIVVGFRSMRDKDNILRHSNLLRKENIYITEDCSGKSMTLAKTSSPVKAVGSGDLDDLQPPPLNNRKKGGGGADDLASNCNSDYAPSSHSGNSSGSSLFAD